MSANSDNETWLRGGLITDGTGATPFVGDVCIHGGKISAVVAGGAKGEPSGEVLDCAGLMITPGFIDVHTHSDVSFLLDASSESKVLQGVTTEVIGNCGFSPFPVHPRRRADLERFLCGLGFPRVDTSWVDFDGYASVLAECRPVMNLAPLVGHGALRIAVLGNEDRPITSGELDGLMMSLRDSLRQGAFGLSTGLTYVPSRFAEAAEIHALARVLRQYDALYATHSRAAPGFGSFDEAIDVGRQTGVRVQFSHVALNDPQTWGRADDVIERFQTATEEGVDVRYDVYPYDASASSLTQYLPGWLQAQGEAGLRGLIGDCEVFRRAREELARGLFGSIPWDWGRVLVALAGPGDEHLEGRTIAACAAERDITPEELCLELCARHGNLVQVVLFYRAESDVATFLAHPLGMVGSDGSAMRVTAHGRPHPRSFGAHARVLQRYVREVGVLDLADAIYKCTLAAADRLGIADRGIIRSGACADVAVFDLGAIRETATWTKPCQLASGMRDVWINGEWVVREGKLTRARPGQVLRRGGA